MNETKRPLGKLGALATGFALLAVCVTALTQTVVLPDERGSWLMPEEPAARLPAESVCVSITGIGRFDVDPLAVTPHRPDVFQPGHLSVYDVLAHLGETSEIELAAHYDEALATHVITSINGESEWWYEARYDSGWFEANVTRMDLYPIKDGTDIRIVEVSASRLELIYESFAREVSRLADNGGKVIIPSVTIEGRRGGLSLELENADVSSHAVREDLLQPGTITALDVILSLGEQGLIDRVGLTWYDRIASADPVDSYWIERIEGQGEVAQAMRGCGFVYELGPRASYGFSGAHVHIPTDARVLVAPEYALWFWICLQPRRRP